MSKDLSISQVAQQANISASAIRYYESVGLLVKPKRASGQRKFDASVLQRLSLIDLARRAGFGISDIRTFIKDFPEGTTPSARWQKLATHKLAELETHQLEINQMQNLLQALLKCECTTLDECERRSQNTCQ